MASRERRRLSVRRLAMVAGGIMVVAVVLVGGRAVLDWYGVGEPPALESTGDGGILQPLAPDTALSVGVVAIRNRGNDPIELVKARLLRLDPDVELLGFGVLPMGPGAYGANPPLTWLEYSLRGQVPLAEYPPIPPARDKDIQAMVTFGLRVKPQGAGKAVGIEVTYRQDRRLRTEVFEEQVYVCWVPTKEDDDCPGVDDSRYSDVFGDFDDEVKAGKQTG